MIGFLAGKVSLILKEYCIVETNGVGYRVFMTNAGLSHLTKNTDVRLYIYTSVREDAILLYGFFTQSEYEMFLKLISVSGIGPKVALGILSAIVPDDFIVAIMQKDLKALTNLPGVGKKTAERLVLELKDKLGSSFEVGDISPTVAMSSTGMVGAIDEAIAALLALGYDSGEVMPIVKNLATDDMDTQAIIKAVLKAVAGR